MGNTHSVAPYGAQINQINAELACAFYDASTQGDQPYVVGNTNLSFSTTSPLTGGSGQNIYYSDVTGRFTLPSPTQYAQYNYTSWTLDIAVNFDLTNASPGSATILQSINNSFDDPSFHWTSSSLGPYTLGSTSQSHSLLLADVVANFTLFQADGSPGQQGRYQCQKATPQYIISSTAVDESSGPDLAPSVNSIFPATPNGYKYSLANVPIWCQPNGNNKALPYTLSLGSTVPLNATNGAALSLDVVAYITIPSQVTSNLDAAYGASSTTLVLTPGANHAGPLTDTPGLPVELVNGSPEYIDLAGNFSSSPNPLSAFRYVIPTDRSQAPPSSDSSRTAVIGPLVAGPSGTVFSVAWPGIYGTVQGYDGQGVFVGELATYCDANTSTILFSIPIA